ncbi:D-glycero-beta-D-manno-heptose 1-phosphate adenylyltransferase [Hippea alviniae]|uniref:D-glycero-beta-D-manno-heptose 1-phosphate adenylyltransferase n=1 Tax=Hippea alviniae TaxID=1279027 RepID=UPI0003B3E97F|nr:D-glycero-beta-D-manno-heptose 1-phosphate adenylyltransferase [Hippea alviniae]
MHLLEKIVSIDDAKSIAKELKEKGKTIGFTNGCFDILHAGHVSYLAKAKDMVDVLFVGLNSDSSVRRLKGKNRPINSQSDRALVLAGLSSVDFVIIFEEDTPIKLIEAIKPDFLFKGADWKGKTVVGADFVLKNGGRVEFIDFLGGRSTTSTIEKVIDAYCTDRRV